MTLRLYESDFKELLIEKDFPNQLISKEKELIQEKITKLDNFLGKGYYKEIYFDGIHIGFGDAKFKNQLLLGFETNFETIEMHFSLKGSNSVKANEFSEKVKFQSNYHNIIYANGLHGEILWESEDFQLCEINISPTFFKKFLPQENQLFDEFRKKIDQKNTGLMSHQHYHMNHQMHEIIYSIMNCKRKGIYKKMFLEAKVLELLLLQFEQFTYNQKITKSLKKKDVDKMYAVKDFLMENLDSTNSLIDLAHLVGTNEFSLKKGFKEIFGKSVFSFWNDLKMEQAKKMLLEEDLTIFEISEQVGYKNQRHFSTAFKKKYGILPSQLKK